MPVTHMEKLDLATFVAKFHHDVHPILRRKAQNPSLTHLVLFENLQKDSSAFGQRTALTIGPACTYKTLDEVKDGRLGDVPSRFQYPVAYVELPR